MALHSTRGPTGEAVSTDIHVTSVLRPNKAKYPFQPIYSKEDYEEFAVGVVSFGLCNTEEYIFHHDLDITVKW